MQFLTQSVSLASASLPKHKSPHPRPSAQSPALTMPISSVPLPTVHPLKLLVTCYYFPHFKEEIFPVLVCSLSGYPHPTSFPQAMLLCSPSVPHAVTDQICVLSLSVTLSAVGSSLFWKPFFGCVCWELNPGPCACQINTLPLTYTPFLGLLEPGCCYVDYVGFGLIMYPKMTSDLQCFYVYLPSAAYT